MDIKQQELELWKSYKAGNKQALQSLLLSLNPLIQGQVNKFAGVGLPRIAIEMEAKSLAIQAFDSYNPALAQLNTHVTNYLKKLQRFVMNYQNIGHIPEPRAMAIGKYNTIYENLETEVGREPTITELSDAMSWSPLEVERLQSELRKDLSITHATGDEDDASFYFYQNPFDEEGAETRNLLHFIYYDADPLNKKIMEYTFPQFGTTVSPLSRKEISQKLHITTNEVRKRMQDIATQLQELK